ncbi:DUF1178 family protein [Microvirga aerophila]|jgi:hypothetical protein|uniref:DUF1178 family protein n=1 Tax=Microvirga aerophila TaxID=670291 RepID=A0A512BL86_9HYPH|nr:DUF1178 family protein [Microvirga aerophila]GEO12720.1 hypothetical protein MAE02_04160 [Microvirga aerophila]
MIKYALACEQAHPFESWFPSSEAYETQRKRGFVTCPYCNSAKVEKQIMAPSVARKDKAPVAAAEPQPVAAISEKEKELRAMIRAFREHVLQNSENVGKGFAEEARKMHYGEAEERSIYGEAESADVRALLEEGIDILPLPVAPDDRN